MGDVLFYHLTRRPLEETLPALLGRALGRGWRVVIRGTDEALLHRLDERLWLGEGFLPHGLAGGPHDARQPVLLTTGTDAPNGAACLMAVGGAGIGEDEVRAFERTCVLFDGGDPAAVEAARDQWRRLTKAGVPAEYWSEEGGSWARKARHPAGEG